MTKHIFVTGGVASSLGKGLTASSLGRLLKSRGLRVTLQKLDPYINVDPGTMNPFQHGEVFVTTDGGETDLDLGHYERFVDVELTRNSNATTGSIYQAVLAKERRGAYLGQTVSQITSASFWAKGNNAIVVTYDEGDDNTGCCDAGNSNPNGTGGGQVATVVVTSHGPRHVTYPVPSNHYSLLATIQDSFGLGCLQFTCDTGKVKPLSPLLTVTGAPAVATTEVTPPNFATPTPTPVEPQSFTTSTASSGGWSVVPSPLLGTNDNSLGAVAGSSPSDVWAVGNFLPDTASSNQDATLSLTDHFDGTTWTAVPTASTGEPCGLCPLAPVSDASSTWMWPVWQSRSGMPSWTSV